MELYHLDILLIIFHVLNEIVSPSHSNWVAQLVSHHMLGHFLGEYLLVGVVWAEHLDDLDFLGRVFANLVHTLLMDQWLL